MIVSIQYPILGKNASEIVANIEDNILTNRIPRGATLPTVRTLATSLGVSPTTVASAYRTLRTRGILNAQGRNGTKVSLRPPLSTRPSDESASHLRALLTGNPDPALLPRLHATMAQLNERPLLYGETANRPKLLTLAMHQLEADKIPVTSLTVLGGALDAIERVVQAHLKPGDRVAVEDPGYNEIFDLVRALGLVIEPVAIDEFGLIPAEIERALQTGVKACILTPRAQNPTGAALDEHRARALRELFDTNSEVLVIEDDHAGPVAGVPAFTVCHGKKKRWAVIRSVSKSLGPDLRLAILTGDATTVARVEGRQHLGAGWVSNILQKIVEALWSDPTVMKRLQAAADTYNTRRAALITALERHGIAASGRSGMNVWIPVREESGVVTSLAAAGWAVRGGERYRLKSPPAVRVTVSTLQPNEARKLAVDLARILHPDRRTHSP